jgi:hypothetical protein
MSVNTGWPEFFYAEGDELTCIRIRRPAGTGRVFVSIEGEPQHAFLTTDDLRRLAARLVAWAEAIDEDD